MLRINISRLCIDLEPKVAELLSSNSIKYAIADSSISISEESDGERVKAILTEGLASDNYVVAENDEDNSEIAILRKGDIEEVGLYLCSLCAMVFRSSEEKRVHESSHLFGFGF